MLHLILLPDFIQLSIFKLKREESELLDCLSEIEPAYFNLKFP